MRRKLGKDMASLSIGTDVDVECNVSWSWNKEEGDKGISSDRGKDGLVD